MSLVADYGDSSGSSSDDSDSADSGEISKTEESIQILQTKPKLPTPDFGTGTILSDGSEASVFKNPFIEAENAKEAILQKHVKMVDTKDNVVVINGKKICWNYRKGRCRFGHNCKFAHDSDIQKTKDQLAAENQIQQTVLCQSQSLPQPSPQELEHIKEESLLNQQKRKRPGLTQGLIPGKKVMKNYISQKGD